ncbi:hypothetical protein CLV28_0217 [Sediminihabitans luteus]|uniref:Uncharacterized protein n=1 Tax=Sediminihabitans luteus TaxID=1138585 RepID=A0A2M9CYV1_9CELL|nr:hypothetical protein [Sediminihabitans luteus]PJJ77005.1 hypothetical protein CLV28_0217 [Sediminihabitans luteus]GII99647.1 hypothetical protein Slu03_20250 [Sediminihabitans luteus]
MPETPWLDWPVGSRVVVRRRTGEADAPYADVLGTLLASDEDGVVVRRDPPARARGPVSAVDPATDAARSDVGSAPSPATVTIPAAEIALGKVVPPRPVRRRPPEPTPR